MMYEVLTFQVLSPIFGRWKRWDMWREEERRRVSPRLRVHRQGKKVSQTKPGVEKVRSEIFLETSLLIFLDFYVICKQRSWIYLLFCWDPIFNMWEILLIWCEKNDEILLFRLFGFREAVKRYELRLRRFWRKLQGESNRSRWCWSMILEVCS